MNIHDFYNYCLSFPRVSAKLPFEDHAKSDDKDIVVFYVEDKKFCYVNPYTFEYCDVKCDPVMAAVLQVRFEGVIPGKHTASKSWIRIYFNRDVPDRIIKDLIKGSYDIAVASLTKKKKTVLEAWA